jgi:mannose-6-phosphate isomerase
VRGVGIELMSNSDNVVRCGLTAKHVDVAEALAIVDVRPAAPPLQTADRPVHTFDTPVEEFSLTRVELAGRSGGASRSGAPARPSHPLSVEGPAIVLLTGGAADLEGHGRLVAGEAILVPAVDGPCRLTPLASADGDGLAWVARPGP